MTRDEALIAVVEQARKLWRETYVVLFAPHIPLEEIRELHRTLCELHDVDPELGVDRNEGTEELDDAG